MLTNPVFLICSERSGSNLIRTLISSHSCFHAPMPLHLVRILWANIYLYGNLEYNDSWHRLIKHTINILYHQIGSLNASFTEEELLDNIERRTFKDLFEYIFEKELNVAGKSRLLLKENHAYNFASMFLTNFPSCKLIFQVRDPRDVVLSMKKSPIHRCFFGAVDTWERDQAESLKLSATLPENKLFMLRYEDLLTYPEEVLSKLCHFLDIPYEKTMIDFYRQGDSTKAAKKSVAWSNLEKPLMNNNFGKYRDELSAIELNYIEYRLCSLMDRLGYSIEKPISSVINRAIHVVYRSPCRGIMDKLFLQRNKSLPLGQEEKQKRKKWKKVRKAINQEQRQIQNQMKFPYKALYENKT